MSAAKPIESTSETFWNATTLLQVAQNLDLTTLGTEQPVVQYNSTESIKTVLDTVHIGEISQASGVPLAQVESSLNKLQSTNQKPTKTAKNLTYYDRTVFSCAIQKAIESNINDPLLITIEECVGKLLTETERLTLRLKKSTLLPMVMPACKRISSLADQLLLAAKFVVLTDTEGKIQLTNGVFVILLNQKTQLNHGCYAALANRADWFLSEFSSRKASLVAFKVSNFFKAK